MGEQQDLQQRIDALTRELELLKPARSEGKTVSLEPNPSLRSEETLRESDRFFHGLVEATQAGVFRTDAAGYCIFVDSRWLEITGLTAEQALGIGWTNALHPDDYERVVQEWYDTASQGKLFHLEYRVVDPAGNETWVQGHAISVFDEHGAITGHIGTITDLTEQRKSEAHLRRVEEQLRQSQKMQSVGSLAGGVAHDFNNLLSVIVGYANMALEDLKPTDPLHADLEQIAKAAHKAGELTGKLLAFSRQQILNPQIMSLNDTLSSFQSMLRPQLGEHVGLVLRAGDELGCIYADAGQIEQVLMNLVTNARDAMPSGGTITIETTNMEVASGAAGQQLGLTPGDYVVLSVEDHGSGIAPEVLPRIFEPFFSTKEQGKGTGLGLSMAYGIIKQSGGHIWAQSELDRGTTIKICFPRTDNADAGRVQQAPAPVSSLRGTETVLLAEDSDMVRATVSTILRRYGYHVLDASNGAEALDLCEQFRGAIDLLLTDVTMPGMNGRQLAARVVAVRSELKVLYMSGYAEDVIVEGGVLNAGISFVQKPIMPRFWRGRSACCSTRTGAHHSSEALL